MLRVALVTAALDGVGTALLRGLPRHEFHLVTLAGTPQTGLPDNVVTSTSLPAHLPAPVTGWRAVEAAARALGRGLTTDTPLALTAGLRLLSRIAAVCPPPPVGVAHPTFGPDPLAGISLPELTGEVTATLRPLAVRLPPVHLVHAVGAGAGVAALAHHWRTGTPYLLAGACGEDGPLVDLCRRYAARVVDLPPPIDPAEYPPLYVDPDVPGLIWLGDPQPDVVERIRWARPDTTVVYEPDFAAGHLVVFAGGDPLDLARAMMSGRPVVAVSTPEVDKLVGDAGLLIPPAAPVSLAAACVQLLREPPLRWDLGFQARKRALARHSLAPWLIEHERLYAATAG